jgi:SAM-dependent methyltransferase
MQCGLLYSNKTFDQFLLKNIPNEGTKTDRLHKYSFWEFIKRFSMLNFNPISTGYTLRRYYVDEFQLRYISTLTPGTRILDLGGNKINKRGRFDIECYELRVIYANLVTAKHPDVQADAAYVPFKDGSFEAVICTELLEHVQYPETVLHEVSRVLIPGGKIFITVPFMYRIHGDPYDFGRYTDQYWQCTLKATGFQKIEIERQGLFYSVLADYAKQYASEVNSYWPFGGLIRLFAQKFPIWALRMEQKAGVRGHSFFRSFTTGFGIIAVKGGDRREILCS